MPLRVEHIPADRLHSICGGEISVYARAARCLAALRINIYPVSSILYSLSCVVFLRPSMFVAPKLRSLHFTSPTPSMSPRGIFNKTHPSLSILTVPTEETCALRTSYASLTAPLLPLPLSVSFSPIHTTVIKHLRLLKSTPTLDSDDDGEINYKGGKPACCYEVGCPPSRLALF